MKACARTRSSQAVVHQAQLDVDHLHRAEVPLDPGQVHVGRNHPDGVQLVGSDRRAQNADPVEGGLNLDRVLVADNNEALV